MIKKVIITLVILASVSTGYAYQQCIPYTGKEYNTEAISHTRGMIAMYKAQLEVLERGYDVTRQVCTEITPPLEFCGDGIVNNGEACEDSISPASGKYSCMMCNWVPIISMLPQSGGGCPTGQTIVKGQCQKIKKALSKRKF